MKKHVFNAGPCILPQVVIVNAIAAIQVFKAQPSICYASRTAKVGMKCYFDDQD